MTRCRQVQIPLYLIGLAFFYWKYVPLAVSFQLVLIPLLAAGLCLTWRKPREGILFFIGAFPLVNSLPYFFGIAEPLPFSPMSLVLFLFVFLGYLLHGGPEEPQERLQRRVMAPIALLAVLVAVSAVITACRYANFFPFRSPRIYELTVNSYGVRAGGALMSVALTALTYLSGLALFLILSRTLRTRQDGVSAIVALGAGTLPALVLASVQYFGFPTLGANPTTIALQLVNGTFKDAMALGAFGSMAAPLFLGVALAARQASAKIGASLIVLAAMAGVLFSGSKVAMIALFSSALFFVIKGWSSGMRRFNRDAGRANRRMIAAAVLGAVVLVCGAGLFRREIFRALNGPRIVERFRDTKRMIEWRGRAQWMPAWRMAASYPLSGVGVGAFIIEAPNLTGAYEAAHWNPESAENIVLQVLSEMGLPGIACLVWLVAALAGTIRAAGRSSTAQPDSRMRLVKTGAYAALLAFAVDSQWHSYIGSPEIYYLLWLLVGLLFIPGDPDAVIVSDNQRRRQRAVWTAAAAAAVLVFGAVHLWNSTHSLSLPSRTQALGLPRDFGLYPPEQEPGGRVFRWTRQYGGFPLEAKQPVAIQVHASHPDLRSRPLRVRFYWMEDVFGHRRLVRELWIRDPDWTTVELPAAVGFGSDSVLLIESSRTWNPSRALGLPDARDLGVAVEWIVKKR